MDNTKELIEKKLNEGRLEEAKVLIEQYEAIAPDDIDIISMKTSYSLLTDDIENAAYLALQGVRRLPLNADMYYNLAYVYELTGQWMEAFINYYRAQFLYKYSKDEKAKELDLEAKITEMLNYMQAEVEQAVDEAEQEEKIRNRKVLSELFRNQFGFRENAFRSYEKIVGKYYYENEFTKKFVGVFKDQYLSVHQAENENMDVIHLKAEFLDVKEGMNIRIYDSQNKDQMFLLPIACEQRNTVHVFQHNDDKYPVIQYDNNHFNYYRIENDTSIISNATSYYGNPIPLKNDPTKKKLVLNIFVDGLSQQVLEGSNFEKNMPYTYNFFKKGTICNRAYNAAEWTYPSVVNYVTGLDTTHHMLFHNELDCSMPLDTPTLTEYFHNDGYYTAKFCGDWRMIPSYGYARGCDRFVYQHQWVGFKVQDVIGDAINHLEAFKDINQYCWISIGDLHDIADAKDLPVEVQKDLPLSLRTYEDKGETSAKQGYSQNKTEAYIRDVKYVDRWLHMLYSYLEENYTEDEIVVSLFSDHGQGYLIKRDAHFLSKERSNVAFMFRGGLAEGQGIINEIISSCDYSSIMRKLAGVKQPEVPTDGRLPKTFGGEKERKYALTESIHPKDYYQAVIFAEKESFFFVNPYPVSNDGRFELADYTYWLEDNDGNRLQNEELCKRYLDIILKHIAPILIYK